MAVPRFASESVAEARALPSLLAAGVPARLAAALTAAAALWLAVAWALDWLG